MIKQANIKRIGIQVVAVCLLVLGVLLGGCGAGAAQGDPAANFQGTWELESADSTVGVTSAEMVAQVKDIGLVCTMDLNEDGTLSIDLFGDVMTGTWEAIDATQAALTIDGVESMGTIADGGKLVVGSADDTLTFVRPAQE